MPSARRASIDDRNTTVGDSRRYRNLHLRLGMAWLRGKLQQGGGRAPPGLRALLATQTAGKIVYKGRRVLHRREVNVAGRLVTRALNFKPGTPPLTAWSIVGEGSIGSSDSSLNLISIIKRSPTEVTSSRLWLAHRTLDFVGKATEVFVDAPESLTFCWVRSQVTDQCGLGGLITKLFDRRLIIPHGLALSGCWVVNSKFLVGPAIASARCALRSSSSFSAPDGRSAASSRAVLANDARRSCRGNCWLKRRRLIMARSFPFLRKAGAQPAFTSPIRAKGRAVMQDQCH